MRNAQQVDRLIGLVIDAANNLAACKTTEGLLDFTRQSVKSEAISRIMALEDPQKPGKTYSATAAADIVSNDRVFAMFEADRRDATAATIRAMGEYHAARLRAEFAVRGSDLEVIGDEPVAVGLGADHKVTVG